ncbi:hypothetical protein ACE1TF_12310 [Geomicrobium sp. JSM 1781026]|uniref:response regulator aspartate phosphatase n=1 Tax=Geomicrobium sp. JSM 1781026 TaxID=3344580 RepID=UPI0035C151A4
MSSSLVKKIGEWLRKISHHQIEEAESLRAEIEDEMRFASVEKQERAYFDLVYFKHQLIAGEIVNQPERQLSMANNLDQTMKDTNHTLQYLYHYMEGIVHTSTENYAMALKHFTTAEKQLGFLNEYEQAEFYFRQANVYYRIDQNITALNYVNEAYETFKNSDVHVIMQINCLIIKGGIYSESGSYDKANEYFSYALKKAAPHAYYKSLVLRGIALNDYRYGLLERAEKGFKASLVEAKNKSTNVEIKTKYNLANTYLRQGHNDLGEPLIAEVESIIEKQECSLNEYKAKCLISRGLYFNRIVDNELIEKGLDILQSRCLLFEKSEMATEVYNYYKSIDDYQKAVHYLEVSSKSKQGDILMVGR